MAVAGLAPRRAARPHHSWKPTRWARLGAKMAMSCGMSSSVTEHLDADPAADLLVGGAEAVVLGLAHPGRAVDDDQGDDTFGVGRRQPQGGHGAAGRGQDDGTVTPGRVHDGQRVAAPALDGGIRARRQGIGQPEPAGVEADQAREVGHPLGVAEPVGLVDGLVDGDHEPAVELEHVDRVVPAPGRRPRPGSRRGCRPGARTGSGAPPYGVQSAVPGRPGGAGLGGSGGARVAAGLSGRRAPGGPAARRSARRART